MGGNAPEFVYRDGSRLTPWMNYCIDLLSADMQKLFGVVPLVTSGIRTHEEQIEIFLDTYTAQDSGSGSYGDVRWWQGVRYVRTNGSGTAAAPGESNHEIQGDTAAMDLRDTGDDPGISTMGSARSEWLRLNAAAYGLVPEGFLFGEAWHYAVPGIYQGVPASIAGSATTPSEEDDMPVFIETNHVITWANGYTNSYDPNVFEVLRWVAKGQTNEQWCIDIWISEAWKAASYMATFDASKVPTVPVLSAAEIAAKVVEALATQGGK